MAEKNLKSKETDITGVLVIALVVMIGFLIVKVTSDFTSKKITTATKAAPKQGGRAPQYDAYCQKKFNQNFAGKAKYTSLAKYVTAYTYQATCGSLNYKIFNLGGVLTSGPILSTKAKTEPGVCCIPLSQMFAVNDAECTSKMPLGHWSDGKTIAPIPAVCKNKSDCSGSYGTPNSGQYTIATSVKCDNVTSNFVNAFSGDLNRCCMMPLRIATP